MNELLTNRFSDTLCYLVRDTLCHFHILEILRFFRCLWPEAQYLIVNRLLTKYVHFTR